MTTEEEDRLNKELENKDCQEAPSDCFYSINYIGVHEVHR